MLLLPQLLYQDGAFRGGIAIDVDERTGVIRGLVDSAAASVEVERVPGVALLPGFVNAHSHAFQRLIRGRTQWRPASASRSDFWSWRSAMYEAALTLTPDEVAVVARQCFLEMLHAGFTTVGEFHYLHRDVTGARYADPLELARRVIGAAREVGLRIRLLNVCYARGGIGRELRDEQRRFGTPDLDEYIHDTEALAALAADPLVGVGVAPHSVRAVPREWLRPLAEWASSRDLPLHMHVSEQPAEVDAAVEAWGLRPVQVLAEEGVLASRFTAVHATHVVAEEIALLAGSGATVCACPTTERDLGDGFLAARALLEAGVPISLGSDSQTRIDPFEEMRLVEYHERLRSGERVVLARPGTESDRLEVAPVLLQMASGTGAACLDFGATGIRSGAPADLVAIDLAHPMLAGWTPATLPALLALCAGPGVVRDVWVGGVRRVRDRRHRLDDASAEALARVGARVAGAE